LPRSIIEIIYWSVKHKFIDKFVISKTAFTLLRRRFFRWSI